MTDPKSKPIPSDALIYDLHPSRFLKPYDLIERWKVTNITVTISRLAYVETIPVMSDIDPETKKPRVATQPVMYFKTKTGKEFERGMLVGAAENVSALKAATGASTIGDLIGKRVTILIGEHRKKPVLRISPEPPAASASNPNEQKGDVITAFSELCKKAGIDQETRTAILRECGGDFDEAYKKISEQYKEVLA
jgi:hypothetical protein